MRTGSRRSRTAEGVAALRAAGALERDPAHRNRDYLAGRFIGALFTLAVAWSPLRRAALRRVDRRLPGIYPFLTARTRRIDEVLLAELESGVEQLVIIGAGADDASPAAVLDRAGVARQASTMFICEGVMPYLREDAVGTILSTVTGFGAGSSIIFDYLFADRLTDTSTGDDAAKYKRYVRRRDEPFVSGFDPRHVRDALAARGLMLVSHLEPTELLHHYAGGNGHDAQLRGDRPCPIGHHDDGCGTVHLIFGFTPM
ncbi:MAG TPA: class I SAM-dependent methyltransferase [Actinopolymorphaceae bacterium]|nr:class I SAM-dependent methyltransferase [Actinopolymorphaceae bacterium]